MFIKDDKIGLFYYKMDFELENKTICFESDKLRCEILLSDAHLRMSELFENKINKEY